MKFLKFYWVVLFVASAFTSGCQNIKSDCREDEYSAGFERIGVLRSTDHGKTWRSLGNACFHAPELIPVDPSPLADDSGIILYFLDLKTLNRPNISPIIYRSVSSNGVDFKQPEPAFIFGENITDPFVLLLNDGNYRMYLQHLGEKEDIISAFSQDGLSFKLDEGYRTKNGAIPGALILPDGQIRLFVAGNQAGITSLISQDGLSFTPESGVRIPTSGISVTDPNPLRLQSGGFLLVYTVHPEGTFKDEQARLAAIEIFIANSLDGFNWTVNSNPIAYGSVPGMVEDSTGNLYIYYVDASHVQKP